jgi:hypothetical protein
MAVGSNGRRFIIRVFPLYLPWLAPQPFLGHPCCVGGLSFEFQLAKSECLLVKTHSLCLLGHPKRGAASAKAKQGWEEKGGKIKTLGPIGLGPV